MPTYVFEWSTEDESGEHTQCGSPRAYKSERLAIAAARKMFAGRTQDANDELRLYEVQKDGWGNPTGRYIGHIGFNELGTDFCFYAAISNDNPAYRAD